MSSEERQQQILKILEEQGRVLVKDLADKFKVSVDAITEEVGMMEKKNLLKRAGSDAIRKVRDEGESQPSVDATYERAIAETAVSFIKEGMTVFIGDGPIYNRMLSLLPKGFSFTVVTNSLEVAYTLKESSHIHVYLIGGKVKNTGAITDTLANEFAQQFILDLSFAVTGGISAKGLSTAIPDEAIFHKMIYDQSKKIVALMEHTKFGVDQFAGVYPIQYLDVIITDEETNEANIDEMKVLGAKVIIAHNE